MNIQKLPKILPIIIILFLGLLLRLWHLETLTTFGGDQAYDYEQVYGVLHGKLTLLGPRIGPYNNLATFYLGPIYYYLLAPFLWFTKLDPIGASYLFVLSRLATTLFVYLIAKKLFNEKVAIFAAIISTLSPYWFNHLGPPSIVYLVVPLVALSIFLILNLNPQSGLLIPFFLGIVLGNVLQMHYLAFSILPAITFYWLIVHPLKFKGFLSLATGFLIALSPLILFETRHQFFLTRQLVIQFGNNLLSPTGNPIVSKIFKLTSFTTEYLLGISSLSLLIIILFFLILLLALRNSGQSQKKFVIFLINIIFFNALFALLYSGELQPHYLAATLVPFFILTGLILSKIHNRYLAYLTMTIIAVFLLSKNNFLQNQGYTHPEDLTLKEIRKISQIIAEDAQKDSFNIANTLDGDSRAGPYRYLCKIYGRRAQSPQVYDRGDHLYVITRDPYYTVPASQLFEIASFQPASVIMEWPVRGDIRLVKLSKKLTEKIPQEKFVTIVNPVRSRKLWVNDSLKNLTDQIQAITARNLKATWLLQYDTLLDQPLVEVFRQIANNQELGAFLEVSEQMATDASVSYKVADGDYYRPDKVFLSGYTPHDRQKLIKTYFNKFREIYGKYPQSVGAWYIDAKSQYLLSKLGVMSALTVADQFNTDAASVWGKYFSMPYYPSRSNSLEPAINQSNKISIVNIQWAQRDPVAGYGKEIKDSRQSFQANDYISNEFDFSYFDNLLSTYLKNQQTDFMQITIGLEAGQEAVRFKDEFEKQLTKIQSLTNQRVVQNTTMADFAKWYQNKYPGISPSHFLTKDESFWFMSPKMRAAIFKENDHIILKDLRYYLSIPFKDYLYQDENHFFDRKVNPNVDQLVLANQIDLGKAQKVDTLAKFDRLLLKLDNRVVEINLDGVFVDSQQALAVSDSKQRGKDLRFKLLITISKVKDLITSILEPFKYSQIEGQKVFGVAIPASRIIGFRGNHFGIYHFQFQSFSKFLTPANLLKSWQPWIL